MVTYTTNQFPEEHDERNVTSTHVESTSTFAFNERECQIEKGIEAWPIQNGTMKEQEELTNCEVAKRAAEKSHQRPSGRAQLDEQQWFGIEGATTISS